MKSLSQNQLVQLEQKFVLARQYHQAGNLFQAEKMYKEILGQIPLQADTLNALGLLKQQQDKMDEAIEILGRATRANRSAAHFQLNLGEAYRTAGRFKEASAAIKRALQIQPRYPEAEFCLGSLLHDQKQQQEAIKHYSKAIALMPSLAPAHNALGVALQEMGNYSGALEALQAAIGAQPNYAEAYLNLGNTFFKMEDFVQAEQAYQACLRINPKIAQAHLRLAWLLVSSLGFDDAKLEVHVNYAVEHLPASADSLYVLAKLRIRQGQHEDAKALLRQSIEIEAIAPAIFELAHAGKFKKEDPFIIEAIHKLLEKKGALDTEGHGVMHFSLGKMYDDLKQYDAAFEHYRTGNAYIRKIVHYDRTSEKAYIDRLISIFTSDLFAKRRASGNPSQQLVFVVGMPRSGTTLTEQIISSHPDALGVGELSSMASLEEALPELLKDKHAYPELLTMADTPKLKKIADSYIKQLNLRFSGGEARIIDKMPHNFLRIGLIALLFPNAKIIHMMRDPMDNCLSLYFQKFVGDNQAYAYDFADIAHQYLLYRKLMAHWYTVLPGHILDVHYEDMIADPEYWTRKLIGHVGLKWDDVCLAPHKSESTVKTASHWQVRQPIYKTSVKRWKHYEKHLGSLKGALDYKG